MVPYYPPNRTVNYANLDCTCTTATSPIVEDYPAYAFDSLYLPDPECLDFTEDKECNENERVVCKGTSIRRELKKLPNSTGYKARKEFWR